MSDRPAGERTLWYAAWSGNVRLTLTPVDVARRHHEPIEIRSLLFVLEGG
jgi:hypothetical protein